MQKRTSQDNQAQKRFLYDEAFITRKKCMEYVSCVSHFMLKLHMRHFVHIL